jgi:DNA-binding transcriptional LysR family regulator
MTNAEPSWDLYRTFLSVLKEGSLSGAARALGLTQPTVGRHIDTLEQMLELSLFVRSQTGFEPTEAAASLATYAETLAATSAALLRAASGLGHNSPQDIRGTVRVTASEIVSVEVLPPILAGIRRQYPQIAIELAPSNRIENLLRREADIAVRMQRPEQDVLIARRIGNIEVGMHAHRSYLKRCGTPSSWKDLSGHTLIGIDQETGYTRSLRHLFGGLQRDDFHMRTDSDVTQLACIRAGIGIGFCQVRLAQRHGALVRVLPELFSLQLETWLAMHENLRSNPACQAVFTALAEGLADYAADHSTTAPARSSARKAR